MPEKVTETVEETVGYESTEHGANIRCDGDTVSFGDWSEDAESMRDAAVAIARYNLDAVVVGDSKLVNDGIHPTKDITYIIIEDDESGNFIRATSVDAIEDLVNAAHHLRS